METKATEVVLFADTLEENAEKHYGILFENGFILCFCCGGMCCNCDSGVS